MKHYIEFINKQNKLIDECKYELILLIDKEYSGEYKSKGNEKDKMIRLNNMFGTPLIYALKTQGSELLYRECMWQSVLNTPVCISKEWKSIPRNEIISTYEQLFKLTYGDISYNKFTS